MNTPTDQRDESPLCGVRNCLNCGCIYTDGDILFCPACMDAGGPFTRSIIDARRAARTNRVITRVCMAVALAALVYVIVASVTKC